MKFYFVDQVKNIEHATDKQEKVKLETELYSLIRNDFIGSYEMGIAKKVHSNWEATKFSVKHTQSELMTINLVKEKCEALPYLYKEIITLAKQQIARQQKNTVTYEPVIEEILSIEESLQAKQQKNTVTNEPIIEEVLSDEENLEHSAPAMKKAKIEEIPVETNNTMNELLNQKQDEIDKFTPSTSFNPPIHKFTPSTIFNPPTEKAKNQQQENIITKGLQIEEIFSDEENLINSATSMKKPIIEEIPVETNNTMNELLKQKQDEIDKFTPSTSFNPPTTTEMNWNLFETSESIPHTVATTSNTTFVETKVTNSSTQTDEQVTQQEINNTVIQNETTSQPSTSSTQKTAHFHP